MLSTSLQFLLSLVRTKRKFIKILASFCSSNRTDYVNINYLWFNNDELLDEWHNHIEIYHDTSFGKCYKFKSGLNISNNNIPIKRSKRSGVSDGLHLYLNTSIYFDRLYIYVYTIAHSSHQQLLTEDTGFNLILIKN